MRTYWPQSPYSVTLSNRKGFEPEDSRGSAIQACGVVVGSPTSRTEEVEVTKHATIMHPTVFTGLISLNLFSSAVDSVGDKVKILKCG